MLEHLHGISPSTGGTSCQLKKKKMAKNVFFCIGASICIGRETLFLLYAGIFYSLSEMEVGHIL